MMKIEMQISPMPLKCWQHPWGFFRVQWRGAEPKYSHGWALGLGMVGFTLWIKP